jgi:hypothetical protein
MSRYSNGARGATQRPRCALLVPRALSWCVAFGVALLGLVVAGPSFAAGNELVLRRLAECRFAEVNGRQICVEATPDTAAFRALTRDLGLAMSPKGMAPAETLGQAGFEYGFELVFNVVDSSQDYWQRAVADRNPSDLLLVSQIHFRKGLPFSFELGAILSHLFDSDMWGLGVELAWALHEDYLWPVPDLGVRGFVSNVVGSADLNLTVAGFDAVLSVPLGVANVLSLTPYAGYNFTRVFSSSRLLDASPEDNTPPIQGVGGVGSIKPEFVFDDMAENYHRFIGGMRFRYAVLNWTVETSIGADVLSFSLHLGMDF